MDEMDRLVSLALLGTVTSRIYVKTDVIAAVGENQ
jgi:hypothetical protein